MSCDCCPGKDILCRHCPHWIGHKKRREEEIERITEEWANKIGNTVKKVLEETFQKQNTTGEHK